MKKVLLILLLLPVFGDAQIITTIAGNGYNTGSAAGGGYSGDGGPATAAELSLPNSVATDRFGNIYICDAGNSRIRKINTAGIITTIAGTGVGGYNGDNILATVAQINGVGGISVDNIGNVYIADIGNYRVRKIDTVGIITTIAGNGSWGFTGDGGPATAAEFKFPSGVTLDAAGNIYIADRNTACIRKINTSGIINTFAGNGLTVYSGDGGPATAAAIAEPQAVTVDNSGNIYIADVGFGMIRKVDTANMITTVAGERICCSLSSYGDGGPATAGDLLYPTSVAVDTFGNIYIADQPYNGIGGGWPNYSRVRMVNTLGIISTFAGNTIGFNGDGLQADSTKLNFASGIAIDRFGNVLIADLRNQRIRMASATTSISELSYTPQSINLFPNPATTELLITSTNPITTMAITNLIGQTVYTHEYNAQQVQVDVANLSKGIYLVKVNGSEVRKFVKE